MQPTPNTRGRHALRWVLGVGLVFVVISAMALQVARRRADERWESLLTHWDEACPSPHRAQWSIPFDGGWREGNGYDLTELLERTQQEGNMFRVNRRVTVYAGGIFLFLRQE